MRACRGTVYFLVVCAWSRYGLAVFAFLSLHPPRPHSILVKDSVPLGNGQVLRQLLTTDVSSVVDMAMSEYMPILDRPLFILDLWDSMERAVYRAFIGMGFYLRAEIGKNGFDHVVYCVLDECGKKSGSLLGVAEISLQSYGSQAPMFPIPRQLKELLCGSRLIPYVSNVLVSPTCRRKGIGSALMSACEETARVWGYPKVCLHVEPDTSRDAISLYERRGYELITEHSTSPSDSSSTALWYMRKYVKYRELTSLGDSDLKR